MDPIASTEWAVPAEPVLIDRDGAAPQTARHPSLFAYSPGIILLAIVLADAVRFADPDLWGHVRFGLDALKTGRIVTVDPYSYTAFGHAWLNHEWLTEVLMGWLYTHMGVVGLKLLKLSCSATAVMFVAAALAETGAPTSVQACVLLATSLIIAPQMQFRPQAFTFAMLAATLFLLARDRYRGRAPLWMTVPMLALWANLHGGFILGLAALGTYTAVCGAADLLAGRGLKRFTALAAVTAAATIATVATPYGMGTWSAVMHALRNPYTRAIVDDWKPFWWVFANRWNRSPLATFTYVIAAAEFLVTMLSWITAPTPEDAGLMAFAALMGVASMVSMRNLPAMALALAVPLARHLPDVLERRFERPAHESAAPAPSHRRSHVITAAIAVVLAVRSGLFSQALGSRDPFPVSAVNFMQQHKLRGNILCSLGWGEYLIWHVSPESQVFIDGRYDTVFPLEVVGDFIEFNYNLKGANKALNQYDTDFVLISTKSPAGLTMKSAADWRLIYRDTDALLYARDSSPAARLSGVPVSGSNPPLSFP